MSSGAFAVCFENYALARVKERSQATLKQKATHPRARTRGAETQSKIVGPVKTTAQRIAAQNVAGSGGRGEGK